MNHFQRYLAEEFVEEYSEGRLSRRQALKLIASVTGSLVVAGSFLAGCAPPAEETATPAPNTPLPANTEPAAATAAPATEAATEAPTEAATAQAAATTQPANTEPAQEFIVQAGPVEFPGEDGANLMAHISWPMGEGTFQVVLVCHENRGLTDHIRDVTERLTKAGYVGLAVDLLSRQGGSAAVGEENVPGALGQSPPEQFVADFRSGWEFLKTQAFADTERLGMLGFCFGGGVTWQVATQMPELRAAVPFYGPPPDPAGVPNIQAAVLAVYGALDTRITSTLPAIEAAMEANGKVFEPVVYEGADHAFHNDTSSRYNAEAAMDAWARTLAWFEEHL
jgi:carboxymethylenebutenolidase